MKKIQLVGQYSDRFMNVSDDIYDAMSQFRWYGNRQRKGTELYAVKSYYGQNKRNRLIYAHRYAGYLYGILDSWDKEIDHREIDHIDHNGLNNSVENLRAVTKIQNAQNRKNNQIGTSKFKGVCWHKKTRKWCAYIQKDNKQQHLGLFSSEIDAAKAYDEAAIKFNFLLSSTNFKGTLQSVQS